ncbi:MAG: LysM peptidoglycan-binding domain-containing protein [Candidatus Obscuribacter phosphatis]|uniref:LysM peptidoglycan-binding domain-containing protein n=1 Tax=Candidatus Obscuribacter phosphatis TaxID=1906157 RepID=A0A8J7PHZ0_9BACT|nr:LysM peptidoglycan-binding domain-containing protein [Candidatus Obscuribacter phosphatis]
MSIERFEQSRSSDTPPSALNLGSLTEGADRSLRFSALPQADQSSAAGGYLEMTDPYKAAGVTAGADAGKAAVSIDKPVDKPVDAAAAAPVDKPADKPVDAAAAAPVDKPADKPVDAAAAAPADKPVDKPVDAAAAAPADKPAEKPADKPVSWADAAREQAQKPVNADQAGEYEITRGDTLSGIAARMLKQNNQEVSRASVQEEMKRLLELNPELKANPDLIRAGDKLKVSASPEDKPQQPAAADAKADPRRAANPEVPAVAANPEQNPMYARLSPEQKAMARQGWDKFLSSTDKDGSGTISQDELIADARKSLSQSDAERRAKGIFRRLDKDGNGQIDFDEALPVILGRMTQGRR